MQSCSVHCYEKVKLQGYPTKKGTLSTMSICISYSCDPTKKNVLESNAHREFANEEGRKS